MQSHSYYALAMDPLDSSVLYLGGPGVYKTTDGGANWSPTGFSNFPVQAVAVDSTGVVYVKSYDVYATSDGGSNWTRITDDNRGPDGSLAIDSAGNVYVGLIGKIKKSTDHGASWQEYRSGLPPLFMQVIATEPANPDFVYAGSNDGFHISTDGAADWHSSNSGFVDSRVGSVAVDPTNPLVAYAGCHDEGLSATIDGGSSWARINTGFEDQHIVQVAVDPANGSKLYALLDYDYSDGLLEESLIRSTDNGKTWERANKGLGLKGGSRISWLVIDPLRPRILYSPSRDKQGIDAIYRSTTRGSKWKALTTMIDEWQDVSPIAIDPLNHKVLYIGVDYMIDPVGCVYALQKTTDRGATWASVYAGFDMEFRCMFNSIVVDPTNDQIVYAAWERGALKSTNGGADWAEMNNGLTSLGLWSLVIDPVEPSTLYAASGQGVFKSVNGGNDWFQMNQGLLNLYVLALALSPSNHKILYAATAGGVYVIEQTGASPESLRTLNRNQPEKVHSTFDQ